MLQCISAVLLSAITVDEQLRVVDVASSSALGNRFKLHLMVAMNTVGLQVISASDKLESFDIMRIGGTYKLRKVTTCQDQAHS